MLDLVKIYDNQFVISDDSLDEFPLCDDIRTIDDLLSVLKDEKTYRTPRFYFVVENGEITKLFLNPNPH